MAEVQDEDQWLYGDDKEETTADKNNLPSEPDSTQKEKQTPSQEENVGQNDAQNAESAETNGEANDTNEKSKEDEPDGGTENAEQNGDKSRTDADEDSSSDDEPTVTIGKIVKQPDIMRPPPPTHRAAPTSGLKDEDFNSVGKINGVPATDYNLAELEEKPWRKPGADLSDYFNYGFTEDTWIKYCERQKAMRMNESGIGLVGLGINIGKSVLGSSNIPVSIVNENSKYGGMRKPAGVPIIKTKSSEEEGGGGGGQNASVNTIQVMTADRRTYSNKVLAGSGGQNAYDDMDFGGRPYGDFFHTPPPPSMYTPPPPPPSVWGGVPSLPPPGWAPSAPPPMPHHRGVAYFDEDSVGGASRSSKDAEKNSREMSESRLSRERDRDRDSSRHHSSRRRSRSRSKSRHRRRSRSRSRSRSPSHRHKRKKSKRERDND